jgi:hypothetical protein
MCRQQFRKCPCFRLAFGDGLGIVRPGLNDVFQP